MLTQIFLGVNAVLFIGYGLYCLFSPGTVEDATGLQALSADGKAELRAMYGGVQTALGALALGGLLRPALQFPAVAALCFIFTGLACARLFGIVVDEAAASYTFMALAIEVVGALVAFVLMRRG